MTIPVDARSLRARVAAVGTDASRVDSVAESLERCLRALGGIDASLSDATSPATQFVPIGRRLGDASKRVAEREPDPPLAGGPGAAATWAADPGGENLVGTAAVAAALRDGTATAVEVVGATLRAVERANERWPVYTAVADDAMRQAEASDRRRRAGEERGPLDGVVVAVKDVIDVAGLPTRAGSKVRAEAAPAPRDARAVGRLRAAGAIILGKTHTHEFALGGTGENPYLGDARNPWDERRITGGSSSGSAVAVATGLAHLALGTDAGGSVRGPATLCGVVGFKPTFGRYELEGTIPSGWSLDHLGTLGLCVGDVVLADAVLRLGPADREAEAGVPTPVRLGVAHGLFTAPLASDVARRVEAAISAAAHLGWLRVDLAWPDATLLAVADTASWSINAAEAATYHASTLDTAPDLFGDDVRARLELGRAVLAGEYLRAQRLRRHLSQTWSAIWSEVDLLITPACPVTAFERGAHTIYVDGEPWPTTALNRFFRIANLTGWPAISLPCGRGDDGLPVGIQLLAAPGMDSRLLRCAAELEHAFLLHGDGGGPRYAVPQPTKPCHLP